MSKTNNSYNFDFTLSKGFDFDQKDEISLKPAKCSRFSFGGMFFFSPKNSNKMKQV